MWKVEKESGLGRERVDAWVGVTQSTLDVR
jgi:hypothetical protein